MFQLMKRMVIGNNNNPLDHIEPIMHRIKIINIIEFVFPDLKDRRGNLIKWIGLIIKKQTKDKRIIEVLGSP